MPSKKPSNPPVTEHDVEGHKVRIVRDGEREQLWVDGKRLRVFTNSGGYVLSDNAYVPASRSLLDAAKVYLKQLRPAGVEAPKPRKPRGDE